jgi:hypothetical protein
MTDTMTSQNIDLPSRSRAGWKDNTGRPSQTTKMSLSRKPFGIGHMFIESFLLRMTDTMTSQNIVLSSWDTLYFQKKNCRKNQNTHFVFSNFFFRKSYRLWDDMEKYCTAGHNIVITIWRRRIACWIPKDTNTHTHSGCVILTAFPPQQQLHESTSMLRHTYSDFTVIFLIY